MEMAFTEYMKFNKPPKGFIDWAGHINENFDVLDEKLKDTDSNMENMQSQTGKQSNSVTVGTVLSGHTAGATDFLCTGTNDEVVIRNAFAYAYSKTSGYYRNCTVKLLAGIYKITGQIQAGSRVILEGEGQYSTIIELQSNFTAFGNCISGLKNLTIRGKDYTAAVSSIAISTNTHFDISHTTFENLGTAILHTGGMNEPSAIKSCKFTNASTAIKSTSSGFAQSVISDNVFKAQDSSGIAIDIVSHGNIISNNTFQGYGTAVNFQGTMSNRTQISGNLIRLPEAGRGIVAETGIVHSLIANNIIHCDTTPASANAAIYLHNAVRVTITGNVIKNIYRGIYLIGCLRVSAMNNTIFEIAYYAMTLESADYCFISGNDFGPESGNAVMLSSGTYNRIVNNISKSGSIGNSGGSTNITIPNFTV